MSKLSCRLVPRRLALALALAFVAASQPAAAITLYPDQYQLDWAESGFYLLASRLDLLPNGCGFCGGADSTIVEQGGGFISHSYNPPTSNSGFLPVVKSSFTAGSDADLVGNPVVLAQASLTLTASFETARNFEIGNPAYPADYQDNQLPIDGYAMPAAGIGIIDTAGHSLKITGVVSAYQTLYKTGDGSLWLTGANQWIAAPVVFNGTLKGNTQSLATDIHNFATVEFNQSSDGVYDHHQVDGGTILKTGLGALTFNTSMSNLSAVDIAEGTLALTDGGTLSGRITVDQAGILDLRGDGVAQVLPGVFGTGQVLIGARGLTIEAAYDDVSFGGSISGQGTLTVQNFAMALTGSNHFQGLNVVNTTLTVGQGDSLGAGDVALTNGTLALAPGMTAFQTLHVATNDSGNGYGAINVADHEASWKGQIVAGGQLDKLGAGTLTLHADNDFYGTFHVAEGTLKLADDGQLSRAKLVVDSVLELSGGLHETQGFDGSGKVSVDDSTFAFGINDSNGNYSGEIAGNGQLVKIGTGTQYLTGTNSFSGQTIVAGGTLAVAPQSLGLQVQNDATLEFIQNGGINSFGVYSGFIDGSGRVVKSGDGVVWMLGQNTYSGGTLVASGALIGNTHSLQGDIETHAGLAFYQDDEDGTYTGNISGDGSLLSYGPYSLTLTGNNTHSGGTAFSNTLQVSRDANLGAPGSGLLFVGGTLKALDSMSLNRALVVAPEGGSIDTNGHRVDVTGSLTAQNLLNKIGEGTLVLHAYPGAGVSPDDFTGSVNVVTGALFVDGILNASVLVQQGANFSPGDGIGFAGLEGLYLMGDLTFDIAGSGDADSLSTSDLIIQGGHIHLAFAGALPVIGADGLILARADTLSGFDPANVDYGGLTGYQLFERDHTLVLAAVPEAEPWTMLIAGLGLVGGAVGRRKRGQTATPI